MAVTIPSWVRPTDVLESIRTGAHIGLQLAQQQQAAAEAEANRQEYAQRASEALQMHGLETALRLMEMRARNAELAGYHKESVDARKAADVLRGEYQKGLLDLRKSELSSRDLHNVTMEDIAQQRADAALLSGTKDKELERLDLPPGYYRQGGHVVNIKDNSVLPLSSQNSLFRQLAKAQKTLNESTSDAEKAIAAADVARASEALGATQRVTLGTPGYSYENMFGGTSTVPPGQSTTNLVFPQRGSMPRVAPVLPEIPSAALTNASPRLSLPMPKLAPTGVRVRQKSTGRLGTWTDEGPPPSDFEIIEEGKIDEGPDDAEFIDEEVEQE